MKRIIGNLICIGLGTMLLGTVGCFNGERVQSEVISEIVPTEDGEETIAIEPGAWEQINPDQTLPTQTHPAGSEMEAPTPEPTPKTTRAPIDGDVSTGRFPDYDTGADADWSYQSDELRIAIKKVEDEDESIVYYVADVWIRNISSFRMGFGHGKFNSGREDPEVFAAREHAILGVSGTMNSGLVIHNGTKIKNAESSSIGFRSGIVLIYRDGSVKTINRAKKQTFNYNKENAKNGGIWQGFQFGPILLQNGEIPTGLKKNERHPRIVFGYIEPGHYVLVAIDGRTKTSIGMTEQEMAELMQSLGCKDAMNLDGGTSAVMLFMGKTISVPSGKDVDGDGVAGRNIVDLLAFAEYDADGNAPELSLVTPDKVYGE